MTYKDLLLEPLLFPFLPEKRIYFLYMVSAILIGFFVLKLQKKKNILDTLREIFNPRVLLHRSSYLDYKMFVFNIIFKSLLFSVVIISSFAVAREILLFLQDSFPSFRIFRWSSTKEAVVYTLVSFTLLDFSRFFQHYCMHRFSLLWRFHRVHHSAIVLTPMTLYRTHPVESIISSFRRVLVIGVSTGFFVFIFGAKISAFDIIGVNAIDFIFNMFASNLRHSHIWLSFGRLNYLFISPAQHQIHHSRNPKHFNKNFGIVLSIWDQLFKSFYAPKAREFLRFGLPREGVWGFKEAILSPFTSSKIKE